MSVNEDKTAGAKRSARTQRRRDQTRSEILETARKVMLRDGFAGFSLSAVADELGLTNPALYYYFNSKQALVFELWLDEWVECAAAVHAAVEQTECGADAVEQLMRTLFDRYKHRLDLFSLVYQRPPTGDLESPVGADELTRIRPINDMLYLGAETRLRADQRTGGFPKKRNPRRFSFTAHMAVIGLLNMKAMVESSNDPLIHSDDELIDDLCQTFRDAALQGESK